MSNGGGFHYKTVLLSMSSIAEGTQIDAYRVTRLLGTGGMGAVYEAVHSEINRKVAIKVLHAHISARPEFKIRFTNEAKIANLVDHPGLVQVIGYGHLPDGAAFLVMEYLKGETLGDRLKRSGGVLSLSDTVRLAYLIADSLDAAHSKGVIHRDLKPDNVMIVPDRNVPGGERTKLLDFGIAKLADNTDTAHVPTQTGAMMGTPAYMSPEQCKGLRDLDARTDVYALGVMLYVMLSGKPPFEGSVMEVASKHMFEAPPPLDSMMPGVQPDIAELALRMLAKDKTLRPTMSEVVATLSTLIEHNPTLKAQPPPVTRPAGSGRVQLRWLWLGLPIGAVAMVAITLLAFTLNKPHASRRHDANLPKPGGEAEKPRFVRWDIDSEPPGAKVISEPDGRHLCMTPCKREQPLGTGMIKVHVQLDGYADAVLQLAAGSDEQRLVSLSKLDSGAPAQGAAGAKDPRVPKKKSRAGIDSAMKSPNKTVPYMTPQPEK
jgi:serine/threonine protein kinase